MIERLSKICVKSNESIKNVLNKLALNKSSVSGLLAGIILVVNNNEKLLGIATDGDIRRALSGGASLKSPIFKIMNKNPYVIEGPRSHTEILALVVDKIRKEHWHKDRLNKIVVVNKNKKVIDLLSFYDLWQSSDVRFKHIGVIGLGYVGLTLALTLADLDFKVKGLEINQQIKKSLKRGKPHFFEAGLGRLLKDHYAKNFEIVNNFKGKNNADIYFIAVGTPLTKNNKPNLRYLEKAAINLGKILKYGDLVILRSTVPIGATRGAVIPLLEKYSNLKAGEGFLIVFAPERTVQGKALEELRKLPQVIGGFNRASADLAANVFSFVTDSVHLVDSLEEAEMVKLVNNCYRDVTFAFANEISLICHKWGIDSHKVIKAANYGYERSHVPNPSPGVGGYCLEKDPFIFIESAKIKNYQPILFPQARQISEMMISFIAEEIISFLQKNKQNIKHPKIFIMGFAFKGQPITSDVRGSTTLKLIKQLKNQNYTNIYGYDLAVSELDIVDSRVKYTADLKQGFGKADVVVIMNNNPDFEQLDIRQWLKLTNKPSLLFDTWGLYNKEEVQKIKGIEYKKL